MLSHPYLVSKTNLKQFYNSCGNPYTSPASFAVIRTNTKIINCFIILFRRLQFLTDLAKQPMFIFDNPLYYFLRIIEISRSSRSQMFFRCCSFAIFTEKHLFWSLQQKRHQQRCFSVNIAKFLEAAFFIEHTFFIEHFY